MKQLKVLVTQIQSKLREGYSISIVSTAHGESLVELRHGDKLVWRNWTFEKDFHFNLKREIDAYCVTDSHGEMPE